MTTMRGTRNCYYFLINFVIQGLKALRAMSQLLLFLIHLVREVCKKSKWKFKMGFAMKGGGSRGGLVCH